MQIAESLLESKFSDPSLCEDGIFFSRNFIAVVDGVTPKGRLKWHGHTSGYYAKEIILEEMERLTGTETAVEALQKLNDAIFGQYNGRIDFFLKNPEERLQATIVIYSDVHKQIWCFGDCQFMVNDRVFTNEMKIDALLAEVRSVYLRLEIMKGKTVEELCTFDSSQSIILPILERQFFFSNSDCDYGFSVLDGFCDSFGKTLIHDVPENSSVILASDGYPRLKATLELSEAALKEIQISDPLCIDKYKSTRGFTNGKSSIDDRAFIRFFT